MFSPPALAGALTAVVLALLTLGPFMRETDQGWLLDGGVGIANGHPEIARADFNFDKQFVSYYLPGLLFKCLPRPLAADTLVLATNLLGLLLFWGSLCWLLARSARRLPLALALPVILVPSFLVYSPFYASAFTSAAFVILLAAGLGQSKGSGCRRALIFALAFCAVGARADAMFLLPLLAMLHSPRRTFVSVLRSPNTWLMAGGGLAAFFWGRALYLAPINDYWKMPFHLKTYLAYVAVGLGGAWLVLLAGLHAVWSARRANHDRLWLAFLGVGLAMPMTYYSFQLAAPRHCTTGAVSVLIFVCARRGRLVFQHYFQRNSFATLIKILLFAGTLGPLVLGLDLAELHHPRLTVTRPTRLPSVAGVAPVGAYLGFVWSIRHEQGRVDQNQAIWLAAKSTAFAAAADGKVPYLFTPVESYLRLAMRLQDKIPDRLSPDDLRSLPPQFYVESRSLMRFQFVFPSDKMAMADFFATTALTPATAADWHGVTIFRGDRNAPVTPESPSAVFWALNTLFGPDEFRLEPAASLQTIPADWAGKKLVLASPGPFSLNGQPASKVITNTIFGRWHVAEFSPLHGGGTISLSSGATEKVFVGVSVFPEWMSVQKL
jgi:hypothetical protein